MTFDAPVILYLAPAIAAAFAAFAFWARRARLSRALRWSRDFGTIAKSSGRWGAAVLGLTGLSGALALAGPRWGSRLVASESKALNLVIAVDISRSMLAEDVHPSRLGRAKLQSRRLIHDLGSDRIGLIAFSGRSYVMSPLTVDGGALQLLVDALDPDISSTGGTELAHVLRQGRSLLTVGTEVADRVLVVFTDGEAHDSQPAIVEAARRIRSDGIRLILVAEGLTEPVAIPMRNQDGELEGYQRDSNNQIIQTARNDVLLSVIADAARGVLVEAESTDQAGTVREIVSGYKRTPQAATTAARHIARAWIPALAAVLLLLTHTLTRRTAALAGLAFLILVPRIATAQGPRNHADEAWREGDFRIAAQLYLAQVREGVAGDTAWLNTGTAALAAGDTVLARRTLSRAARSIDPEVRFRALYNLGLLSLRLALIDSLNSEKHYADARRRYREALLIKPGDFESKWNLELAVRRDRPPPGGGGQEEQQGAGGMDDRSQPLSQGLSAAQAEQILNSIAEEERETRRRLNQRRSALRESRRVRDW